jgi:hypothetical protein
VRLLTIVLPTELCRLIWDKVVGPVGEDWIFLTLLGVVMALLSFAMDFIIERCHTGIALSHGSLVTF